jgi:hypothetical protein
MNYQKKIIAYIDLLGFKSFINFTDKTANYKEIKIDYVNNLFDLLKEFTENKAYSNTKSRVVTQFSDLIVISFEADDFESFYDEFRDIQLLCVNCINCGFLIRGSIVYGDIVHNENIIFGPGLVSAYESEKTIAKFPRIIIDRVIIKDFKDIKLGHFDIAEITSIDEDGFYFIDYFSKVQNSLDNTTRQYEKYILNITKILRDISELPILKEKAIWVFNKYKSMLKYYPLFKEDAETLDINDIESVYLALID